MERVFRIWCQNKGYWNLLKKFILLKIFFQKKLSVFIQQRRKYWKNVHVWEKYNHFKNNDLEERMKIQASLEGFSSSGFLRGRPLGRFTISDDFNALSSLFTTFFNGVFVINFGALGSFFNVNGFPLMRSMILSRFCFLMLCSEENARCLKTFAFDFLKLDFGVVVPYFLVFLTDFSTIFVRDAFGVRLFWKIVWNICHWKEAKSFKLISFKHINILGWCCLRLEAEKGTDELFQKIWSFKGIKRGGGEFVIKMFENATCYLKFDFSEHKKT